MRGWSLRLGPWSLIRSRGWLASGYGMVVVLTWALGRRRGSLALVHRARWEAGRAR